MKASLEVPKEETIVSQKCWVDDSGNIHLEVTTKKTDGQATGGGRMKDLIEALQIFLKYRNEPRPTHCEHDILHIMGVPKDEVSDDDNQRLDELGFFFSESGDCYISFRYGSA